MYCHQLILKKEAERSYETYLNLHKAARRHLLPRYLSGPVLSYMKHFACPLTRLRVHSVDSRSPASKGCVSLLEKMHVYSLLVPGSTFSLSAGFSEFILCRSLLPVHL